MRLIQLLSFPLKHTLVAYGCHKSPKLTISIYRPRCATAVLKKYVRNRSRLEGCITKGYGTKEIIEFCVDFIDDLKSIGVPMSRHEGRLKRKGIVRKKSNMHIPESEIRKANFTVLQNSSLVVPYMDEHINIVRSENPGKPEAWITRHHIDNFGVWLRAKLMGDGTIAEQLQWLARVHQ